MVGQTLVAGANVSAIARSNGLDPSQLFLARGCVCLPRRLRTRNTRCDGMRGFCTDVRENAPRPWATHAELIR
jgi:hypothetical protein